MPALVSAQAEQLVRRLGDRATVDDPIFGRTTGMPALARYLDEVAAWLNKHGGAFDKVAFVTGSDRDVTEGTLSLTFEGRRVQVPLAVVAERRPEREVEMRLYYSTKPIKGTRAVRSPLLPQDDEVAVPGAGRRAARRPVARGHRRGPRQLRGGRHAARRGGRDAREERRRRDAPRVLRKALRDSSGGDGGKGGGRGTGIEVLKGARADDGRICALEYTVVRVRGKNVPPQAGLAVYERGETGLLRAVRVYEDVDA